MSQREEKLWKDFLQGIRDDNEDQVKRILLETRNLNLGGGKSNFLTRKITTTQGTLTVLHLAVKNGAESIIKLLFKNGVNVNATSEPHKFTALHMAVEQDKNGIIQLLLSQKDVNVNACDEYGHTPLKLAAEKGNQETVKCLIEKGADLTKADSVDNTAIHVAADKGHYGVLQLLLPKAFAKNPGIIGKQNKDKNTPLHLAVGQKCQNSVALLLFYGAVSSLELENRHNETPKQLAKGNNVIMDLLKNPSKAEQFVQHLMEPTRPVIKVVGRGGSVEADNGHHPVATQIISQATNASLATVLSQVTGGSQPTIIHLTAPQVTFKSEFHTEVHDGGYAAIGTQSALHVGQPAVTPTGVQSQLSSTPPAGESSYTTNVSGGHASIGDHSVTIVETTTPSTAESIEPPFGFPESKSGTNPVIASSGNPTESENISNIPEIPTAVPEVGSVGSSEQIAVATGSRGALSSSPVPETKNSGTPPGDSTDVTAAEKLPVSVPEAGSTGSSEQIAVATGSCVVLSNPVPETKTSGNPSGNSADFNVFEKLPVSVPEEGSVRSISEKENAEKGLGTLFYPVTESNHPRTPTENSSDPDTPGRLPYPIPEESKKPELGESEATCNSRTETTATTAVSQNAALSSIEGSVNCSSSERCTPLSGIGKKLNHGKASGAPRTTSELQQQQTCRVELKTASTSRAMQGPSDNIKLLEARTTIPRTNKADERSNRLVEQFGSPGPPSDHALAAASNAVGEFKNPTASSRRSSSKEAPHRKEKFVRGNSFPDSDDQRQIPESNQSIRRVGHGQQHIGGDSLGNCSENRREAAQNGNSCVVPIDSDPGDDTKGKERCDKNCKIM